MEIIIRHINPQDHAAIHQIFLSTEVIRGTMRLPHQPLEYTNKRLELSDDTIKLAACVDKQVVGYSELITYPDVPRHRHAGEINMIAVDPTWQGKGVGRALMQAMIDMADNWLQIVRLELTVWVTNAQAIHLYQQCGFEVEGTKKNYVFSEGQYIDACVMGRINNRER